MAEPSVKKSFTFATDEVLLLLNAIALQEASAKRAAKASKTPGIAECHSRSVVALQAISAYLQTGGKSV